MSISAPEHPLLKHTRQVGLPLLVSLPFVFAAVLFSHWTLLRLPYFWDEGGYYVPAALDLFKTGTLIPVSTATNAHPPLPMILMAGWWKVFGCHIFATRVLVCLVAATALLGVFQLTRSLLGTPAAIATTTLTAIYPVWFAQSSLAHADIFAASFTLWGLAAYFAATADRYGVDDFLPSHKISLRWRVVAAILFSFAALAKETAVITPLALAALELFLLLQERRSAAKKPSHIAWIGLLSAPVLPLICWYAYHHAKTGFTFGNPEFLRYNATANLSVHRLFASLYYRVFHLVFHMNMFTAVICAIAALLMPAVIGRKTLSRPALLVLGIVLVANTLEFTILGGALLTRYLLPMYPIVILICVASWQRHMKQWGWLAALSGVAFVAGIWVNPPYAFAPEDNLTYRDMIVLHQQAIAILEARYPDATVLTAWPASAEIEHPELGYTSKPFKVQRLENFSIEQMQRAADDPGSYDTALLFATKWAPPEHSLNLSLSNEPLQAKYFDFHHDMRPKEAAQFLHGDIVWQHSLGGEWAALLHFPRIVDAKLASPPADRLLHAGLAGATVSQR